MVTALQSYNRQQTRLNSGRGSIKQSMGVQLAEVRRDNPKGIEKLLEKALGLAGFETKVGWFENAKEENGQNTAYVAAVQEFGIPSKNIPPRLGFRETASKREKSWRSFIEQAANQVLKGSMTGEEAMEGLGLLARGDLFRRINSNPNPRLKASTLAARRRKGRTHTETLVDSGRMIETLDSKTEKV